MTSIPDDDKLVPDPQVREEFGITEMTEWRWDNERQAIKERNAKQAITGIKNVGD